MARGKNAQLAVDEYLFLLKQQGWSKAEAWKGIALLLLSCDVWEDGYRRLSTLRKHAGVPDFVIYRERNDFKLSSRGEPNLYIRRGLGLSAYLAKELGVAQADLCDTIGRYFTLAAILNLQPNNVRGHAFRSIVCTMLEKFGNSDISYEEEIDPHDEFRGYDFSTRSEDAKLDIIARKQNVPVALITVRWGLRHDRIDVVEEAMAYAPAARRLNRNCSFYGVIGEFAPNRISKVLNNCAPIAKNPPVDALVHFNPELITQGLGQNGSMRHLKSLEWLIDETYKW